MCIIPDVWLHRSGSVGPVLFVVSAGFTVSGSSLRASLPQECVRVCVCFSVRVCVYMCVSWSEAGVQVRRCLASTSW